LVKPVLLVHTYVVAPPAVNCISKPGQIAGVGGTTVITGNGFTVIVVIPLSIHPAAVVPITVYVVVLPGVAVTGLPVDELSEPDGLQV
jgi:hypothetical protein